MEQKRTSKLAKKRKLLQNIKGDRKMNSFVGDTAKGMLNEQKEVASVKEVGELGGTIHGFGRTIWYERDGLGLAGKT